MTPTTAGITAKDLGNDDRNSEALLDRRPPSP